MARGNGRYQGVSQNETGEESNTTSVTSAAAEDQILPSDPPEYDTSDTLDLLPMEVDVENHGDFEQTGRFQRLKIRIEDDFIYPMKSNVIDPLVQIYQLASAKVDFYLNKLGNPLILRRFVYILFMSIIVYTVVLSGLMPNSRSTATIGMFSDKHQLLYYASRSIDFAKFEEDMEYLSSMPHLAGTKGDYAITNYIKESFRNNGLKLMKEVPFQGYMNYPKEVKFSVTDSVGKAQEFTVSTENFNPLSHEGTIDKADLLYANDGTEEDFNDIKKNGLITDNTVLVMHYGSLPSEQILRSEKHGIKGIVFLSKPFGDNGDVIQKFSAAIPQYGTGDALSPGWSAMLPKKLTTKESKLLPTIPVIPISHNQGLKVKSILSKSSPSVGFQNSWYSGIKNDVKCDLKVTHTEKSLHPSWNVLGKIEGKEQNDKAIVIAANHDAACKGALSPNFGTSSLMALLQLFQQIRYKYDWKPLRNIYFISYDGSRYNSIGATELIESEMNQMRSEVYSFIDISQLSVDPRAGKVIDIQATPLLHSLFKGNKNFNANIRNVAQYGDWTPYEANGIPTAVLSSPFILNKEAPYGSCDDDFENWSKMAKDTEGFWDLVSETLMYTFEAMLRLVDEPLLPFDIRGYVDDLDRLFKDLKSQGGPSLDYALVSQGLKSWKSIGEQWSAWIHTWNNIVMMEDEGVEPSLISVHRWTWNKKLMNILKRQCSAAGIPHRSFYKNVLYGPTLWTQHNNHDSWSFPGVRDALTAGDTKEAQRQLNLVGKLLIASSQSFVDETAPSD